MASQTSALNTGDLRRLRSMISQYEAVGKTLPPGLIRDYMAGQAQAAQLTGERAAARDLEAQRLAESKRVADEQLRMQQEQLQNENEAARMSGLVDLGTLAYTAREPLGKAYNFVKGKVGGTQAPSGGDYSLTTPGQYETLDGGATQPQSTYSLNARAPSVSAPSEYLSTSVGGTAGGAGSTFSLTGSGSVPISQYSLGQTPSFASGASTGTGYSLATEPAIFSEGLSTTAGGAAGAGAVEAGSGAVAGSAGGGGAVSAGTAGLGTSLGYGGVKAAAAYIAANMASKTYANMTEPRTTLHWHELQNAYNKGGPHQNPYTGEWYTEDQIRKSYEYGLKQRQLSQDVREKYGSSQAAFDQGYRAPAAGFPGINTAGQAGAQQPGVPNVAGSFVNKITGWG